jgi:phosphoribosylaminoimidazole (AIR) synthetase
MAPTRIYVKSLLRAAAEISGSGERGCASCRSPVAGLLEKWHEPSIPARACPRVRICGEVVRRCLAASLHRCRWQLPAACAWGRIEPEEMARTFNCPYGIGLEWMAVAYAAANGIPQFALSHRA